jgi:hypothetical protein
VITFSESLKEKIIKINCQNVIYYNSTLQKINKSSFKCVKTFNNQKLKTSEQFATKYELDVFVIFFTAGNILRVVASLVGLVEHGLEGTATKVRSVRRESAGEEGAAIVWRLEKTMACASRALESVPLNHKYE